MAPAKILTFTIKFSKTVRCPMMSPPVLLSRYNGVSHMRDIVSVERHCVASVSHTHITQSEWHHGARAKLWLGSRLGDETSVDCEWQYWKIRCSLQRTCNSWIRQKLLILLSIVLLVAMFIDRNFFSLLTFDTEYIYMNCYWKHHAQKLYLNENYVL